jgi:hypothetical protein
MVDSANILAGQLGNVTLSSTWPETEDWTFLSLLRQFQAVSKLIATSQTRQIEREFFYVELGGIDTHNEFEKLDELFAFIDDSLDAFVKELKAQARSHRVPGFTIQYSSTVSFTFIHLSDLSVFRPQSPGNLPFVTTSIRSFGLWWLLYFY